VSQSNPTVIAEESIASENSNIGYFNDLKNKLASILAIIQENIKVLQEKIESSNKELSESNKKLENKVEFNNQTL
jgi:hypothetical protein